MQPCHFVVHFGFHPGRIKSMQQTQMYTHVLYANLESFAQLAQKVAFLPNSTAHVATTFPWGALLGWWSSQWSVGLWPCGRRLPRRYLLCFQYVLSFRNAFKDWVWKFVVPLKILAHLLSKKSFSAQKDLFLAKISMEFSSFLNLPLPSCHLIGRWTDEVGAQPGCEGEGSALLCNLDRQESHPHVLLGPSLLLMLSVGAEGRCQRL